MRKEQVKQLLDKAYELRNIVAVGQSTLSTVAERVRAVYDQPVVIYKGSKGKTYIAFDSGSPFTDLTGLGGQSLYFHPIETERTEAIKLTLEIASHFKSMAHQIFVYEKYGAEMLHDMYGGKL